MGCVYRITDAGTKALKAKDSVPSWYRAILKHFVDGEKASVALCRLVKRHPAQRVLVWLDELDTLGFVEAVPSSSTFLAKYGPYSERLSELRPILDEFETLTV